MTDDTQGRSNAFYTALNKPPTFFGIRREFAVGAFLFGVVLYVIVSSALIAAIVAGLLVVALRYASRNDLDAIPVYVAAAALPPQYDGGRFSPIEVKKI